MTLAIDKVVPVASAIIRNKEGKILMLQRSNVSSYADYWQLVEGKLEEGETISQALKREIQEEIGATALELDINTVFYKDVPVKDKIYLAFRIIFEVKIDSEKIKLSNEHKNFGWFNRDEALNLLLDPSVKEIVEKLF
jgi:mutator protein MutT